MDEEEKNFRLYTSWKYLYQFRQNDKGFFLVQSN